MRLLLAFSIFFTLYSGAVQAIRFPVMTDMRITSCSKDCGEGVYFSGSSAILEIGEPIIPPRRFYRDISAFGIHCFRGNKQLGIPYADCTWTGASSHYPKMTGHCRTKSEGSWELDEASTCTTEAAWGSHTGAFPGGECVLFGTRSTSYDTIITPMGEISAVTAANSGNAFCIKPTLPDVRCDISLPATLDHGVLLVGSSGSTFIDGVVDCGATPEVTVVGTKELVLAPGVRTRVAASMLSRTQVRVQSDMTVDRSANVGKYSAAIVVAVSPY